MNVLNQLSKSAQLIAKKGIHEILKVDSRVAAKKAPNKFIQKYEAKYPKVTQCLV